MFERLKAMLIKEFIQTFRDPRMRVVLFILPMVQTVIFGYAVNMDVRKIPTAVIDRDNSPQSRELLQVLFASGHFRDSIRLENEQQAARLLDSGSVRVALVINHGLAGQLGAGKAATVQALVDGSDSNTAGVILGYLSRFAEAQNIRLLTEQTGRSGFPLLSGAVRMEARAWFNPDLASPPFYVPAVIANILYIITMLLSAMAVVREKEIGTIEQVIVTPIRKYEFILGKTLPFVLIGYANVFLISLVGWLVFRVPVRGSITLLIVATGPSAGVFAELPGLTDAALGDDAPVALPLAARLLALAWLQPAAWEQGWAISDGEASLALEWARAVPTARVRAVGVEPSLLGVAMARAGVGENLAAIPSASPCGASR